MHIAMHYKSCTLKFEDTDCIRSATTISSFVQKLSLLVKVNRELLN